MKYSLKKVNDSKHLLFLALLVILVTFIGVNIDGKNSRHLSEHRKKAFAEVEAIYVATKYAYPTLILKFEAGGNTVKCDCRLSEWSYKEAQVFVGKKIPLLYDSTEPCRFHPMLRDQDFVDWKMNKSDWESSITN